MELEDFMEFLYGKSVSNDLKWELDKEISMYTCQIGEYNVFVAKDRESDIIKINDVILDDCHLKNVIRFKNKLLDLIEDQNVLLSKVYKEFFDEFDKK